MIRDEVFRMHATARHASMAGLYGIFSSFLYIAFFSVQNFFINLMLLLMVGITFFHLILFSEGLRLYSERSHKIKKERYEILRKPVNLLIVGFLVTNLFLILFKGTALYASALYLYVGLLLAASLTLLFCINIYYSKMHQDAGGFNIMLLFTAITLILYAALIIIGKQDDSFLRLIATFEGALLLFSFTFDIKRSGFAAKQYKKREAEKQVLSQFSKAAKHAKTASSNKKAASKKSPSKKKK